MQRQITNTTLSGGGLQISGEGLAAAAAAAKQQQRLVNVKEMGVRSGSSQARNHMGTAIPAQNSPEKPARPS